MWIGNEKVNWNNIVFGSLSWQTETIYNVEELQ